MIMQNNVFLFFTIWYGNHQSGDLTKFGYKQEKRVLEMKGFLLLATY
jgi:hypothetical protein